MLRSILAITAISACALTAFAYTAIVQPTPSSPAGLLISTAELAAAKDPSIVILHIADRDSVFHEAHIPGARFLRYADFAVDGGQDLGSELPSVDEAKRVFEAAGVSNGSRVVIYGTSPVHAARAFFTLDAMGHQRVALLDGGLRAWRAEGRPIETGPAKPATAGKFVPVLNAARVASAQFIQQQMPEGRIALVDVRPDPEFLGTDGGMGGAHIAGHIAGARQLTWNALVQEDGSCRTNSFRPSWRRLARSGTNRSCRTAWSACARRWSISSRAIWVTTPSCTTDRLSTGRRGTCLR